MTKAALVFGFATLAFASFSRAETFTCISIDQQADLKMTAKVNLKSATTASVEVTAENAAVPMCQGEFVVSGHRPALTLTGPLKCDHDEAEDATLTLNTSSKTLVIGPNTFNCR